MASEKWAEFLKKTNCLLFGFLTFTAYAVLFIPHVYMSHVIPILWTAPDQ